jgi:hypothetical protein
MQKGVVENFHLIPLAYQNHPSKKEFKKIYSLRPLITKKPIPVIGIGF